MGFADNYGVGNKIHIYDEFRSLYDKAFTDIQNKPWDDNLINKYYKFCNINMIPYSKSSYYDIIKKYPVKDNQDMYIIFNNMSSYVEYKEEYFDTLNPIIYMFVYKPDNNPDHLKDYHIYVYYNFNTNQIIIVKQ